MKLFLKAIAVFCLAIIALMGFSLRQSASNALVPYPKGYREWVHVKSAVVGTEHPNKRYAGIHHVYANDKALEGFEKGNFADGSFIVFDLLEAVDKSHLISEGPRRFIDVMHKDGKKFAKTGGWGFEEFNGDSTTERLLTEEKASTCFACHASQKERGYVFSSFRK